MHCVAWCSIFFALLKMVLTVHMCAIAEDVIGTFFNRGWSAAPAASKHAATGAKSGRRGTLQVSLTVSAGCVMDTTACNALSYAAADADAPRASRIWPEAGAGLGPGLASNPAVRHPMRPTRTGGLFGRVRIPVGRVAAGALAPGMAGLRPLSPRSPGDARTSPAQGTPGAALRSRGLCRACATGEPAMAGQAWGAEGPVEEALPAAPSAVAALGFRLAAAAARALGLAGVLAGALKSALGARSRLLAAIRAASGWAAWPLWAAASAYAPLGCQRSLAAPCSGSGPFGITPGEAMDAKSAQHAWRGMLWMHRLPMYRGRLLATLKAAMHTHTTSSGHPFASPPGPALPREARPLPCEARAMHSAPALPHVDAALPAALCWAPQQAMRAGSPRLGAAAGADRAAVRSALLAHPRARLLQPGLLTALPRAGWRSGMHSVLVA